MIRDFVFSFTIASASCDDSSIGAAARNVTASRREYLQRRGIQANSDPLILREAAALNALE
jgi:hypothetical protein